MVASREAGMAGVIHLQIAADVAGAVAAPPVINQTVLVTDGPTLVSPPLLDSSDLAQITAFELRHKQRTLGSLPLSPVPLAQLTGEGGFKAPGEFLWNNVAEEELLERLTRLMDVDRGKSA
jgi:hypothetical protein